MEFDYEAINVRINELKGTQPRIVLLVLLAKGHLRKIPAADLIKALETAEGYDPEFDMKSFL